MHLQECGKHSPRIFVQAAAQLEKGTHALAQLSRGSVLCPIQFIPTWVRMQAASAAASCADVSLLHSHHLLLLLLLLLLRLGL